MGFVRSDQKSLPVSLLSCTLSFPDIICSAVQPPHVAESAFSMECVLQHHYDMTSDDGKRTGTVILGRIKRFHIASTTWPLVKLH
jgi:flavin reductase (DIM6/NTAB) family NADH-FMN oxidoreductase RutF